MTKRSERRLVLARGGGHNPRVHLLLLLFALAGCPSEEPPVEPPSVDPTAPAPADRAFAAVVAAGEEAAFFGGIGAEGQVGDTKIFNAEVAFIISAPGRRHGWIDVGGTVVDADLVRPDGQAGRDGLDDGFLSFGISRLFEADTVEVVNDGLDGNAAVVRTVGGDVTWDLFTHGIETPPLIPDLGLGIERTYTLEPGALALRIDTTFTNEGTDAVSALPSEGFMASKEDYRLWFAEDGLVDDTTGEVPAVGTWGTHNEGVFSLWGAEPLTVSSAASLLSVASLRLFNHPRVELEPGASLTRTAFYAMGPDTASVEAARQGTSARTVGTVTDPAGPVAGARVHFVRGEEVFGFAVTAADGTFEAALPEGTWDAWVTARLPHDQVESRRGVGRFPHLGTPELQQAHLEALGGSSSLPMAGGRWSVGPVPVDAGGSVDLELGPQGTVDLDVSPAGAVVDLRLEGDDLSPVPQDLREALGLHDNAVTRGRAWTADGDITLQLPPGSWTLDVGRSWRDEREAVTVDVATSTASVELVQAVPRDGYVSVDTHLHAAPSMDGRTAMEDRLVACAAVGLDLAVTTDHDRFADYRPINRALGLDDQLTIIPGAEVTAVVRGHWNLFPVEPQGQAVRNGGAPIWWEQPLTTTDALMELIRDAGTGESLVQVNHGRLALGMMDASNYQVASGVPLNERLWTWDFDAVEIVTADSIEDWRANRDDWFSFIHQGQLRIPTGSSDTHDLDRACALGHTDVFVGDGPWTADDVVDALRAGDLVVASGVTLRAAIGDQRPGSTVTGGSLDLEVQVKGPSWLVPGSLKVWSNFEVVFERELDGATDGVFFDDVIPLDLPADAWVAVEVDGGTAQGHWWGGHPPYGLTNAFLVDVAGDGWTPPGG